MENLKEQIEIEKENILSLKKEIEKKIIGQEDMVRKILIGILTGNHILLEGLPGLAKSLTVNTLAQTLGLKFARIQFTPDLLPSDIIGTEIYNEKTGEFYTKKGPIFANIILADEINRAPAKVQSALLEAMQEKQITIANETFKLDRPFIVLATQNPIEQDGTYPLPEAQQDRFLMKVKIEYPTKSEEKDMLKLLTSVSDFDSIQINEILNKDRIEKIKQIIREIHIDEKLMDYILDIVFKTRETNNYIACGASPRASIALVVSAKANAFLEGRDHVIPQDIKRVIFDVLRHRMILTYEAEAEGKKVEDIITDILEIVELP
ncbi:MULTISPECIES: AAA family ATPase [Fusobacterium]|jgi:MoxR-like ATPase|uniref:MoxR family ATPase n=1 Tax=Fusobacterium varium ATCC 27725 TaxID=469618 RepID=A0ABN5JKV1_FUSVA|nr:MULTISPECIES: MoxR family ATPase [Fusobacterium]AVQ31866.1 MoxR family ATPase [Fusobacterium varium ATCC 27725]EES63221.1 ATPase family associated with various cellular activities (AAA) [Fusobacterium varium ATCC 27725]MCF0171476.1 MoxR family ATPase [Fusobacterium varium]MCF2674530.1 MoxR family ATPase [Fusobacterium varium]OFL89098.1 ATPase [Fusobacterium sp. HMSC073F01]